MIRKIHENIKKRLENKKGASNLEVIIVMVVALVIGAALFIVGGVLRDNADNAAKRANQMNTITGNVQMSGLDGGDHGGNVNAGTATGGGGL